ncbi:ubiquinol--cytochrome-c reductase subunit COR1 KNAG_0F03620 [Huiozyma naganishii CBS 8797]|uniref:Peptidase M16 C-terminal domain-containing protein n=1 Tax=Huiozyma naganishii (strain ATCC MYA-139 / BCRC 22969 / CBS 8797 / KCTC 17520 / NBRC 10181 / NCYC 3082 / Yp74L-3) TaxID=1071383 RepID=J7S7L1_HUIN7|nr:hypothetical protein KNAG_0F03620 [Kazachstania naganishii CBS 8797]CCK71024.1 hypothetical protein KNAG_0F03620 [Kazachstania naganishii CBS 8797]
MLRCSRALRLNYREVLRRSLATDAGASTSSVAATELSSGLTVVSRCIPQALTESYTLQFNNAGSVVETPYNNGVANLWSHAFKVSAPELALRSRVNRETQWFSVDTVAGKSGSANSALAHLEQFWKQELPLERARDATLQQLATLENHKQHKAVKEHLHSTAFQNTPLALPRRGISENVEQLTLQDTKEFASKVYTAANATVYVTGPQQHELVVEQVQRQLSLPTAGVRAATRERPAKSTFLGSEVRLRDDTLPKAWVAIAVESEPIGSPDFLVAETAAQIFGSYNAHEPQSRQQGIKLLDNIQEYQLCESFSHFNYSYRDTGLWGVVTQTPNVMGVDDLVHFTLKQWNRLSVSITETELERGKAMLKLKLGLQNPLDSTTLARNEYLRIPSADIKQVYAKIDAITVKDLKKWANKRLWDQDIAIAGMGQIEGLLDYMRIRNDMSMMRW